MGEIFRPALQQMAESSQETYGPETFQKYLSDHGLRKSATAASLSIDSLSRLAPELRDSGAMVFRLGRRPADARTHFALAKFKDGWDDYFLFDDTLKSNNPPQLFVPSASARQLFVFQLLPRLTEGSLVNLAIASGIIDHALQLESHEQTPIPATGQTIFTFSIRPNALLDVEWNHIEGQVEVDALLLASRGQQETLFLVEAKSGQGGSVAKHKLVYPYAALRQSIPNHIKIVPVYLRTWQETHGWHFLVSECCFSIDTDPPTISALRVKRVNHLILAL